MKKFIFLTLSLTSLVAEAATINDLANLHPLIDGREGRSTYPSLLQSDNPEIAGYLQGNVLDGWNFDLVNFATLTTRRVLHKPRGEPHGGILSNDAKLLAVKFPYDSETKAEFDFALFDTTSGERIATVPNPAPTRFQYPRYFGFVNRGSQLLLASAWSATKGLDENTTLISLTPVDGSGPTMNSEIQCAAMPLAIDVSRDASRVAVICGDGISALYSLRFGHSMSEFQLMKQATFTTPKRTADSLNEFHVKFSKDGTRFAVENDSSEYDNDPTDIDPSFHGWIKVFKTETVEKIYSVLIDPISLGGPLTWDASGDRLFYQMGDVGRVMIQIDLKTLTSRTFSTRTSGRVYNLIAPIMDFNQYFGFYMQEIPLDRVNPHSAPYYIGLEILDTGFNTFGDSALAKPPK